MTSILADNTLGTTIDKVLEKQTITKEHILKEIPNHTKRYNKTIVKNAHIIPNKHNFKSDDHRYDKRFKNFDYAHNGYYSDDGYYYGYYDTTGYFYNNIFFTYNSNYTYNDRLHRRGYFRPKHHHHRRYRYHRVNNWNRIHHYREVNQMIYGDYFDQRYYHPTQHSNNTARVIIPRKNYTINQSTSRNSILDHHSNRNYNTHRERRNQNYSHHRDTHTITRTHIHRNSNQTNKNPKRDKNPNSPNSTIKHSTAYMQISR
jgi:hypothetical protein